MNYRPLADRVLIKPDETPSQTASGLHLVEHWTAEQTGVVAAIGALTRAQDFQVGEHVIFPPTAGQELILNRGEADETRYLLMRESDVLAVIESDAQVSGLSAPVDDRDEG